MNIRKQGLCKAGRAYSVWSLLFMPQISSFRELFSGQLNKNTFPFEYVKVNQNVNGECIIFTSILSSISKGNIFIEKIKCLVFF